MTIHWKAVEQYFTVDFVCFSILPMFQFYFVIFEKLTIFRHGILGSERVNHPLQFNRLRPSIKLQILLLCFHTFITDVEGRSCSNINRISFE